MTTDTIASPLDTYRQGRDKILAVLLDAMSGLEGSVLEFEHVHEGKVRSAGVELSDVLAETARLERLVGEQVLELDASRTHVCAVPEFTDGLGLDPLGATVPGVAPVIAPEIRRVAENNAGADEADEADEATRTIAELRAELVAERRTSDGLRAEVNKEQRISAGLRDDLDGRDRRIVSLEAATVISEKNLLATFDAHQEHVRDTQETFEERLAEGVRTAETAVRGEAVRIIEAIAADNPELAEAADLFTVAFPAAVATADREHAAPELRPEAAVAAVVVPVPGEDFFASIPAADPEEPSAPAPATDRDGPAAAPPVPGEDFFNAGPAPMTQVYLPAPDLGEDPIMDPNFFDTPVAAEEPVQAPAPDGAPVEAPKPSYGIFGRKKEDQNV